MCSQLANPLRPALGGASGAPSSQPLSQAAFTLVELLIVIAVLVFGALMLLPAMARTQNDSRAFQCLNNNRQLNRAWRMWSDDNEDRLLAATAVSGDPSVLAWVTGTLDYSPGNTSNWDPSVDIMQSPLWLYCGTNLSIWKCPSDQSRVIINGEARPRVRSFAMNYYFGNIDVFTSSYRSFKKFSEINALSPSQLFVFLDMREDHINFGRFLTDVTGYSPRIPAQYTIYHYPGLYHDGAATFSYADGRGELRRWQDRRTTPPLFSGGLPNLSVASPNNPDVAWLQDRATRPR